MAFIAILYPANAGPVNESKEQDAMQDQQEKTETMDAAMEETTGKETSDATTDATGVKNTTETATEDKQASEEEVEKDETEAMDIRPSQVS